MPTATRPPIFQELQVAGAVESGTADGRWLVVSVTARTDPAGRAMDDGVWRHPAVCAWIEQKALTIQIDIASDRDAARALNVRGRTKVGDGVCSALPLSYVPVSQNVEALGFEPRTR